MNDKKTQACEILKSQLETDVENLNQLLNSEITSIKREDILNTLLNY